MQFTIVAKFTSANLCQVATRYRKDANMSGLTVNKALRWLLGCCESYFIRYKKRNIATILVIESVCYCGNVAYCSNRFFYDQNLIRPNESLYFNISMMFYSLPAEHSVFESGHSIRVFVSDKMLKRVYVSKTFK